MDVFDLLSDAKAYARVTHQDEDTSILLMLAAAAADVAASAEYDLPEDANDLPADLRFAIIDQAVLLFDVRGSETARPIGLSLAASKIVARYRGVRMCPANP